MQVFSLSFLDVFACALGAFILVLLMLIQQVTAKFHPETIKAQIEEFQQRKNDVMNRERQQSAQRTAAEQWRKNGATMAATVATEIQEVEQQIKDFGASYSGTNSSTQQPLLPLEQLRAAVEQRKQEVQSTHARISRRKDTSVVPLAGGSAIGQRPRILLIGSASILDIATNRAYTASGELWTTFLRDLTFNKAIEYPLFLIKPDGVDLFKAVQTQVEGYGVLYGMEPYTRMWDPIIQNPDAGVE